MRYYETNLLSKLPKLNFYHFLETLWRPHYTSNGTVFHIHPAHKNKKTRSNIFCTAFGYV